MKKEMTGEKAVRGRPRTFCCERALESALEVFWEKGYEGTSMTDLTRAMGINRPSLYAAFGGKEKLFRKALDLYTQRAGEWMSEALDQPTARRVVENLLRTAVERAGSATSPRACMLVGAALACGESAAPIQKELATRREKTTKLLKIRFERALQDGDLKKGTDVGHLARYVAALLEGLAVQTAGGVKPDELLGVVDTVMRAWVWDRV